MGCLVRYCWYEYLVDGVAEILDINFIPVSGSLCISYYVTLLSHCAPPCIRIFLVKYQFGLTGNNIVLYCMQSADISHCIANSLYQC